MAAVCAELWLLLRRVQGGRVEAPRGSVPTVVGQPVNATSSGSSTGAGGIPAIDVDEVMGTDYVVAVKMPLLSIS